MEIEHVATRVWFEANPQKRVGLGNPANGTLYVSFEEAEQLVNKVGGNKIEDLVGRTFYWDGNKLNYRGERGLTTEERRWLRHFAEEENTAVSVGIIALAKLSRMIKPIPSFDIEELNILLKLVRGEPVEFQSLRKVVQKIEEMVDE